jgi:hypothetical protein
MPNITVEDTQDCVVWPTQKGPGIAGITQRSGPSSLSSDDSHTTLGNGDSRKEGTKLTQTALSQCENLNGDDDDDDSKYFMGCMGQDGQPVDDPTPSPVEKGKENEMPMPPLTSNDINKARWPPVTALVKNANHAEFLQAILTAVDDCGCQHITQAKDKVEPKVNAWMKLLDICYGGNQQGRGKLARFGFKPLTKATDMKKKVLAIWRKAVKQPDGTVESQLKELCQIQLRQYSIACEKETSDRQKSKDADALLQEQMSDFQRGIGAKPPGAVGRKGGGQGEHSTNTRLGQPATFQFANSTTKTAVVAVEGVEVPTMPPAIQRVTNETSPVVSSITTTPANRSKTSQGGRSTPKNSGSVNSNAMERINAACVNFEKIADRLCLSSDQGNSKKITNKPTRLERNISMSLSRPEHGP